MRILAIHLRNLNSLAGTWTVDFTVPEYTAGIFAITGPTGAGKSTLLDALCLALFARTPRLGHISKTSNEIMTRRTGDCFAEVEFETRQGRFRCHWAQHRARRSPGGELQAPKHEIVDAATGKVLETRSKEVGRLVEQVTGMEYDRFTRSILLAQGDFAAFLDAEADQRAPILEQITGTGIYSRISVAVHERTSEERREAALLQEALGQVVLLKPEEEQALTTAIAQGLATAALKQQRLAELGQSLHRLDTIAALESQITATDLKMAELSRHRQEFAADLLRFERGRQAQALSTEYNEWTRAEEQIAGLRAKEAVLRAELAQSELAQQRITVEYDQARKQTEEMVAQQQRESEVIAAVRALDLRLHEKRQIIQQRETVRQRSVQERDTLLGQRQELERQRVSLAEQQEQLTAFFRDHGGDGLLVEELTGLRQQLLQWDAREQSVQVLLRTKEEQELLGKEARQRCDQLTREVDLAAQELELRQQRLHQVEDEQTPLLAGQDVASWRVQLEQTLLHQHRLEQVADLLTRKRMLDKAVLTLTERLAGHQAGHQQQTAELLALEERQQLARQLVAQCEQNRQLALRIRSLEEERQHLHPGAPCPLCGATEHPWAEAAPPVENGEEPLVRARAKLDAVQGAIIRVREGLVGLSKEREHTEQTLHDNRQQHQEITDSLGTLQPQFTEGMEPTEAAALLASSKAKTEILRWRVQEIDRLTGELTTARAQVEQTATRHAELGHRQQTARLAAETLAGETLRLAEQIREEQTWVERCRAELASNLQPLGIDTCPPGQAQRLLRDLEARLQRWKEHQARDEQLKGQRDRLQTEQDKLTLLLDTLEKTLTSQAAELASLQNEANALLAERQECYGERDPDVEEQRLRLARQQAEDREQSIRSRLVEVDKQVHSLQEQVRLGVEDMATLLPRSRAQEIRFLGLLPAAGFTGLDDFRQGLLPAAILASLEEHNQGLDREEFELTARRAEQAAALARAQEQQDGMTRDELLAERAALEQALALVQQQIGADRERLEVNTRHQARFAEQQQALAAQERELERWELLHLLIGSADGKKFRVFAQGLTFETMISHANRQLRKMSDRYILLRDPREPLALQVIDNYQAGEIRSTRNLSGGESFLVSLALALGLSAMASHNVRVDSLFLDEGFGTLDEESLDVALQTLAELRQDGKLIGIISHVPMLRDRIDVRIQVQPGPGGNSRLLGPGCVRIS